MSNIVTCEHCHGTGKALCKTCGGSGKTACPKCNGSGKAYHICPDCNKGRVPDPRAIDDDETMTCPTCHGDYKRESGACNICGGTGKVECKTCKGSGEVGCQACDATGKFNIDKLIKAAIVTDWYDVTSDKKINKKLLSREDVAMLKVAAEQGNGAAYYILGVLEGGGVAYTEEGDAYFKIGAKAGDADCLYAHAAVLSHKSQEAERWNEMMGCLERSAGKGNVHASIAFVLSSLKGFPDGKARMMDAMVDEKVLRCCEGMSSLKVKDGQSQYLIVRANAIGKCLPRILKNDASAITELGNICSDLYGKTGCMHDRLIAVMLLEKAAKGGDADAIRQMAEYKSKDNLAEAIDVLDKAAKGGDKKAAEQLQGIMQECLTGIRGWGICGGKETTDKFEELKRCARSGVLVAVKFLINAYKSGRLYEGAEPATVPSFGLGGSAAAGTCDLDTVDWESIAYWTDVAAKAGDGNSMLDYSVMCRDEWHGNRKCCDKDINKAFVYACDGFLKGGSKRRALGLLASFYRGAYFEIVDNKKVTELLSRSAKAGYLPAIVAMGIRYRKGLGVERNLSEAKRLFKLAADKGSKGAKDELKSIPKDVRVSKKALSGITEDFVKDTGALPAYVLSDYEKAKTGELWSVKLEKQIKAQNEVRNAKLKEPKKRWLFVALGIVGGVLGLHFLYVKRMFWFWIYLIVAALGVLQIEVEAFRNLIAQVSPMLAKIPVFATLAVAILVGSVFLMKKDGNGRQMK